VAARRATAVVSKHAPRLDTTTGTRTITRPDDAGPKPDNPYGLAAECTKDHPAPDPDCACGIYATYDIDVIARYVREAPILGLIQGSGTTVPGDDGYRAQRATIACLFAIADEFTIARRDLVPRV
jgi:hypothetical protein